MYAHTLNSTLAVVWKSVIMNTFSGAEREMTTQQYADMAVLLSKTSHDEACSADVPAALQVCHTHSQNQRVVVGPISSSFGVCLNVLLCNLSVQCSVSILCVLPEFRLCDLKAPHVLCLSRSPYMLWCLNALCGV